MLTLICYFFLRYELSYFFLALFVVPFHYKLANYKMTNYDDFWKTDLLKVFIGRENRACAIRRLSQHELGISVPQKNTHKEAETQKSENRRNIHGREDRDGLDSSLGRGRYDDQRGTKRIEEQPGPDFETDAGIYTK